MDSAARQDGKAALGPRLGTLERHRDFLKLWTGQTVSLVGSEVTRLALPLTAIVVLKATPAQVGVLTAAGYVPFLLLTLPAGVWIDHRRGRPVLSAADLGRAALMGLVPLLAALGRLSIASLAVIWLLVGILTVFFELAYQAFLPALLPREHVVAGNSKLAASESVAEIAGPGLGGPLVQLVTAPLALLVDALSFLVSAVSLALITTPEPCPIQDTERPGVRREIAEGVRFVWGNRLLRAFAGEATSYNVCWQVIQTVFLLYAVRTLGFSPLTLGLVFAIDSLGALLGALLTDRVARRIGVGPTILGATILSAVTPLALPVVPAHTMATVALLAAVLFLRGVGVTACNVHVVSLRQAITPDRLRGRMNASYRMLTYGTIPIGALLGGQLGQHIGLRPTLLIGALGLATGWLWIAASPIPSLRRLPLAPVGDDRTPVEG